MSASTWKLAFIGEPGAGKSTCINAVSDFPAVSTDVECTDDLAKLKKTTTVALDYGEMNLGEQGRLLLYGLPGQSRFSFMMDAIQDGLAGVVVLAWTFSKAALWRSLTPWAAILATAAVSLMLGQIFNPQGPWMGLIQRLLVTVIAAWLIGAALRVRRITGEQVNG